MCFARCVCAQSNPDRMPSKLEREGERSISLPASAIAGRGAQVLRSLPEWKRIYSASVRRLVRDDHVKALVPILEKLNLDFDRYINVQDEADDTDTSAASHL